MPTTCAIFKCHSRSGRDKKSFYRIPKVIFHQGEETKRTSERRRRLWLVAINRSDVKTCDQLRVCSDHFISGKPNLYHETSPDWVPSINLGYDTAKSATASADRYERLKKRKASIKVKEERRKETIKVKEAAMSLLELKSSLPAETSIDVSEPEPESDTRKLELANFEILKLKDENLKLRMQNECLKNIVRKMKANMPDS